MKTAVIAWTSRGIAESELFIRIPAKAISISFSVCMKTGNRSISSPSIVSISKDMMSSEEKTLQRGTVRAVTISTGRKAKNTRVDSFH